MGLFSKIKSSIGDLNNISIAVGNVIVMLDRYDQTGDESMLPIAGWLCKKGIQDIMETGNLLPTTTVAVVINRHLQRMTVMEAYMKSVGRYSMIVKELDGRDQEELLDIMKGGRHFREMDGMLSDAQKKKLLKTNIEYV